MSLEGSSETYFHDASDATIARKRRRPAISCARCRRRKIKCDQCVPCNNCKRAKVDDCTYPETHTPAKRASRRASSRSPPPRANSQLPLRHSAPQHQTTPALWTTSAQPTPATRKIRQSSSHGISVEPESTAWRNAISSTSSSAALRAQIRDLEATLESLEQTQEPNKQSIPRAQPSGPKFAHQSRWLNQTTLYTQVLRTLVKAQADKGQLHDSIAACKTVGSKIQEHVAVGVAFAAQSAASSLLDRKLCDELLDKYFNVFEGTFRVLHIPSFYAEYERYRQDPSTAQPLFVHQMRLCLALGAASHPDSLLFAHLKSQWLQEARESIGSQARGKKKLAFEHLQLMCLLCIASANEAGPEPDAWIDAGDLMRRAMSLDLHRDPRFLGPMSMRQAILHRRLWVTILELNLLCSLQAGHPPLILSTDFDACPPADLTDEELDSLSEVDQPDVEVTRAHHTCIQSAFHASWSTRSKIVSQVTSVAAVPAYEDILRLHGAFSKELATFRRCIPTAGHGVQESGLSDNTAAQATLAEILMSRYMLALHLPILGPQIRDPKFHFSRRMAVSTAIEMGKLCDILQVQRPSEREVGTAPGGKRDLEILFLRSAGIFRHLAVQSIFALMLEFVTIMEEGLDSETSFPGCDEVELVHHLRTAQSWAEHRIEEGLLDIHNCCFLAASYAYGNRVADSPDEKEKAIIDGALASSQKCLAALNAFEARMDLTRGTDARNISTVETQPVLTGVTDFDLMGDFNWADMSLPLFDWSDQLLL